jgi:Fic/DOC family
MLDDHLVAWCATRAQVPWHEVRYGSGWPADAVCGWRDGMAHRIGTVERARDPERARRLRAAYAALRKDVQAGALLDFRLLATWQRAVLGVNSVPFRGGPAFAKGGRERYGLARDTQGRLERCLVDSTEAGLPVSARAARAYLDVCFFYPFTDGNARSALLALVFILVKEGVVLDEVGPIAPVQRFAGDAGGSHGRRQ